MTRSDRTSAFRPSRRRGAIFSVRGTSGRRFGRPAARTSEQKLLEGLSGRGAARPARILAMAFTLLAAIAGLTGTPRAGADDATRPPNVILLITDQHHHAVLGCAGNELVRTPNLDRLAAEGVRVSRSTCATPFCSPTRASFVTGLWPHTHGIVANVNGREGPRITDRRVTLDNLLFDHGYATLHLGKWHLGSCSDLHCYHGQADWAGQRKQHAQWLRAQGDAVIDRAAGPGETLVDGVLMTRSMAAAHAIWKNEPHRSKQDLSIIGRSPVAARAQLESWLADQAIQWIERNADHPFFLTYSVSPPHAFWVAPAPYYNMYDPGEMPLPASWTDRPEAYQASQPARMGKLLGEAGVREYLRCYYAQVTMVDHEMGRILDKVRKLGLERDTLVVFTSDHGDMQGGHGMMGKSLPAFYDEILRTPLIVKYPRTIPPGRVLDMHCGAVDLMPTLLDYAGAATPPRIQGSSLRPFLDGKAPPDDRPAFCERGVTGSKASRMIRTREWKYALFGSGRRELFHLTKDPGERRNLAGDPAFQSERERLEGRLRQWMRRTDDPALAFFFPSE